MDGDLRIYIAAHKEAQIPDLEGYNPISVGTALRDGNSFGYISDANGNNISEKNKNFCELTALYWIWKNTSEKYIGLVHYRRFFSSYSMSESPKYFLKKGNAKKILNEYDIILPNPIRWKYCTVAEGYDHGAGYAKDLLVIRDIIGEKYPSYIRAYDEICNGHKASYCNMFVAKKSLMNDYCEWLFDILFEAENRIDISDYGIAEQRIFGYISEILLNVWVLHNDLKVYYMPIVFVTEKISKRQKVYFFLERTPFGKYLVDMIKDYDFNKAQRW